MMIRSGGFALESDRRTLTRDDLEVRQRRVSVLSFEPKRLEQRTLMGLVGEHEATDCPENRK